jgi:hypothetical protein
MVRISLRISFSKRYFSKKPDTLRFMDMYSRNQYLKELRDEYLKTKSKKKKSKLLEEAVKRTRLNRKYLIVKLKAKSNLDKGKENRKKRKEYYDSYVKAALVRCWTIFDRPCGQRLEFSLRTEVDRLRKQKELDCSNEVAEKLKKMSSATIDRKLEHQKEVERLKRKYQKKNPLLFQKIPVKTSDEWNTNMLGNIQMDHVEHCGQSAVGQFICSLSNSDIATGWWEGEAIMGMGQERTHQAIEKARQRTPFTWLEIHPDNGVGFINDIIYRYTQKQEIAFTRSRPYKKNDNCWIEQKNKTHIRNIIGYLRYDSKQEMDIINDLYRNELRLYKNFFQPVIKLISKERIDGKMHKKYDKAKTPYCRVIESNQIPESTKKELKKIYDSLNPAQLKKNIDNKINKLYKVYEEKNNSQKISTEKKLKPASVRFFIAQQQPVSVR